MPHHNHLQHSYSAVIVRSLVAPSPTLHDSGKALTPPPYDERDPAIVNRQEKRVPLGQRKMASCRRSRRCLSTQEATPANENSLFQST